MSNKKTITEFISSSIEIHGNEYDYSKSIYINNHIKLEIVCRIHGSFWQIPNSHISGKRGCPKCGKTGKINTSEFIYKSNKIHNNKYNYTKTEYKTSHETVVIDCPIHGEFKQSAYSHLNGKGCHKCSGVKRLTKDEFIRKAKLIHGDRYDYRKVDYINNRSYVKIICHKHNEFLQKPNYHLNGQGCPKCNHRISKPETEFLDYINIPNDFRQKRVMSYNVDGLDESTKTIYEFLGDYWHGNVEKYSIDKIQPERKITYGRLNKETFHRLQKLKNCGYNIKYIWESDWIEFKHKKTDILKLLEY